MFDEFPKRKSSLDGRDRRCKKCVSECHRRNRENRLKAQRKYRENNKEKIQEAEKLFRSSEEYKKHKAKYDMEYRKKKADKIREYKRNWKKKNKNNPLIKIKRNLRRRINHVIIDGLKSDSTENLIGCTYQEFMKHIESQFTDGMTWENYGQYGWHIDHIRPCCDFDLTNPDQQKECFNYKNCRPLWWDDNLKKSYMFEGRNCRINSKQSDESLQMFDRA